jgi:hypothetical protein
VLITYFTYQYPHYEQISYLAKDGVDIDGNTYSLNLVSDTGKVYRAKIEANSKNDYQVTILSNNQELIKYKSTDSPKTIRNKEVFAKNELPHTFELTDGTEATLLKRNYDGKYELSLNACGDQELIEEAKTLADEWIESVNFNKDEIEYEVPNYCDGEAAH